MLGLVLLALVSGLLAVMVLSVEDFEGTVSTPEQPAISWAD
jgi:hypothetical protein